MTILMALVLFPLGLTLGANTNEHDTIIISLDDSSDGVRDALHGGLMPGNTNDAIKSNGTWFCAVHTTNVLQRGFVPVLSGLIVPKQEVIDAHTTFPNASPYVCSGCNGDGQPWRPKKKEVLFCPACREVRAAVLKRVDPEEYEWELKWAEGRRQNQAEKATSLYAEPGH